MLWWFPTHHLVVCAVHVVVVNVLDLLALRVARHLLNRQRIPQGQPTLGAQLGAVLGHLRVQQGQGQGLTTPYALRQMQKTGLQLHTGLGHLSRAAGVEMIKLNPVACALCCATCHVQQRLDADQSKRCKSGCYLGLARSNKDMTASVAAENSGVGAVWLQGTQKCLQAACTNVGACMQRQIPTSLSEHEQHTHTPACACSQESATPDEQGSVHLGPSPGIKPFILCV